MKKFLLSSFSLLLAFMLIGCTSTNNQEQENPENYERMESLTYSDLQTLAETNFPTGSTYTIVDHQTEETFTGENVYMEDTPHNLVNITPEFPAATESTLLSSAIEDGMIYSNFDVIFNNGANGNVLYINDPETLNFVAATVESEGNSINYQFSY